MRKNIFPSAPIFCLLLLAPVQIRPCGQGSGSTQIGTLPTLGGSVLQVNALNAAGQFTGFSYTAGDLTAHAFFSSGTTLVDLGTLGGDLSQGAAINASGQIVGQADLASGETHAFLYQAGSLVDLGTLGGSYSSAVDINDAGQIAGVSLLEGDSAEVGFIYSGGTMTSLGELGGGYSFPAAMNQSGVIVGDSWNSDYQDHAFLYANGAMTDLGTLGGNYSTACEVNDSGTVIGESSLADDNVHAFIYLQGVMTDLGTFGGTYSSPSAINNAGQVIGWATTPSEELHGFIYSAGTLTDLGTLGGTYTDPAAINNLGQVVGGSGLSNDYQHAFIWQNGNMTDLNTLLPSGSEWELSTARLISDAGRIIGIGKLNGVSRWFVLDLGAANNPPIAVATASQIVDCQQAAVLDGRGSSDPDGDPLTYQWTQGATLLGTNSLLTISLPLGVQAITLTVTDPCGASSQTNVTIQVTDTTVPFVSCPSTITAAADNNCQATVPDLLPQLTAADNCAGGSSLVVSQNPPGGTVLGLGDHEIWFTVSDPSGNTNFCRTVLRILDTTAPVIISGPALGPMSADANCAGRVPAATSEIVAADNCTPANALVITQNPAAGTLVGLGGHTIVVTVTDASGNSTSGTLSFSVVDTTAPRIVSVPDSITVNVGSNCVGLVPNVVAAVVATDNCTADNALVITQNPAAGTPIGTGVHPLLVTVTDAAGNQNSATLSFSVVDTIVPTIVSLPGPFTASASSNCVAAVPDVVSGVVATDNCTADNALVVTQNPAAGTLVGLGVHTIVVTVADASGNIASGTVSFSVVDKTAPTIVSVPAPMTVSVTSNCVATVPNILSSVVAVDNCSAANGLVLTQNPAAGTLVGLGAHSLVVTVTDASGNSTSGTVSLTVVDTTAPTIVSVPGPLTVSVTSDCRAPVPNVLSSVLAVDNCTAANQLTLSQDPAPGTLVARGQQIITVTVTDASGNIASTQILLTVMDDAPPVVTSICASPNVLNPPNHQIVPVTIKLAAADKCEGTPLSKIVSVSCDEVPAPGDITITGPLTLNLAATRDPSGGGRTYTIFVECKDSSGNVNNLTVSVTVPKGNGNGGGNRPGR